MQKNRKHILSTRPIDQEIIGQANLAGIDIDVVSFIDTVSVKDQLVIDRIIELAARPITAVFTSMNAVDAVTAVTNDRPSWRIGSIGTTTRSLVEQKLPASSIIATGNNASELAENLASIHPTHPFVFFCGDQRRDELPSILQKHGIEVEEVVVYRTIELPQKISAAFDGIAFYSPSAVESFFSSNTPSEATIMFAIGETTANTLRKHCNNQVVISASPGKNNLIKRIIDYYTTTTETVKQSL